MKTINRQLATFVLAASPLAGLFGGQSVSLDGDWRLDYFPQPARGAVRTPDIPKHETIRATVPGNCELELVQTGVLPDPSRGFDAFKLRKYEGYQWLYTKTFDARACNGADGSVAELVFGGIDTFADVFLNGEKIGESENMLVERRFDVTGRLKDGQNTVQVLIRSAVLEARKYSVGEAGYHQCNAEREPMRKAAYMGGWDIFPRVFCSGLWRSVSVEYRDPVRIDNVAWLFAGIDLARRTADFKVQFRAIAPMEAYMLNHKVRITLSRNGKVGFRDERVLRSAQVGYTYGGEEGLKDVDFWWPRGMGEPALYDAVIEILDPRGTVVARDARSVGVRSVKLEVADIKPGQKGEFLFRVNGQPCFIRGSNWVPLDPFPCRHRALIPKALEMWKELNCNMIRVWGGGVYEPHEFFDWCDRNGLMVWQDFMTGCTAYPQNDAYAKLTEEEVRQVVVEFRNHASLVLWSGNNENDNAISWNSFADHARDCNHDRLSRKVIPDVLWEYDVTRPYLPSSPYWSPDVVAGRAEKPENHIWGFSGEYYKNKVITNSPAYFVSETGWHGCPNRAALERMMTKDCVYPWKQVKNGGKDPVGDFTFNDEWQYKASNPFFDENDKWGMMRNYNMTCSVNALFGAVPQDLDDFIEASQIVQAEGLKTLMELFRSKKFEGKNGLVWWNMRDGGPVISDAVVDYWFGKKFAYRAIGNSQRDHVVVVRDDHRVFAVNDTLAAVRGKVRIADRESGRVVLEKDYEVPANGKTLVGCVEWTGRGILDIEYEAEGARHYNWFLYGEPPLDLKRTGMWLKDAYKRIR